MSNTYRQETSGATVTSSPSYLKSGWSLTWAGQEGLLSDHAGCRETGLRFLFLPRICIVRYRCIVQMHSIGLGLVGCAHFRHSRLSFLLLLGHPFHLFYPGMLFSLHLLYLFNLVMFLSLNLFATLGIHLSSCPCTLLVLSFVLVLVPPNYINTQKKILVLFLPRNPSPVNNIQSTHSRVAVLSGYGEVGSPWGVGMTIRISSPWEIWVI